MRPDFFSWIGYELHLNDRQFDQKPPLYYLTGWEGTLRRQGLFSGPNNYGYFLVAFFPVILAPFRRERNEAKSPLPSRSIGTAFGLPFIKGGMIALWILAIVMTLSRAAILGGIFVLLLTYRPLLKRNKKLLRGTGIAIILAFLGLSVLKWDSTLAHITSKLGAIPQIIQQPLGYGLGSS
ncbi:MAG: hypothetical protein LBD11_04615 [Candidatus Peribacteria bacterium]|nr:hypothetical protein [Candidatus Peribacteria bacterium]